MALPTQLTFELVTPDHGVVTEQVDEVQLPGTAGYLGILPGHTPLLTYLEPGELWYRKAQQKIYISVSLGFVEVLPDRVTILAQTAERAEEIDAVRAEAARQRAESELNRPDLNEIDFERARVQLIKALARLQVAHRARTRG